MKLSHSNFNLRSPDSDSVHSYLITVQLKGYVKDPEFLQLSQNLTDLMFLKCFRVNRGPFRSRPELGPYMEWSLNAWSWFSSGPFVH